MADGFNQNTNQANTGYQVNNPSNPWSGVDFSGRLNQMLSPEAFDQAQQLAQKFSSPYATMNQNSWLARNHPQVAGVLDNAFLATAMTPQAQGPEGAGGGISRMMQGLVGGQQFQRQRMMQQAMLPFQMMQPRLQAADTMAQIMGRGSEFMRAQDYHEMITDRWGPGGLQAQRNAIEQQRADQYINPSMLDHRRALLKAGLPSDANINNATPEQLEKYNDAFTGFQRERLRQANGSSETERMVNSEDQERVLRGQPPFTPEERNAKIIQYSSQMAGARTGATASANQPYIETKDFMAKEEQGMYADIGATFADYLKSHDPEGLSAIDPKRAAQMQTDYRNSLAQRSREKSEYFNSTAPEKRLGFFAWLADKGQAQAKTATPSTSAAPAQAPARTSPTKTILYDENANPTQ
jgi:hypothetical protein